MRLKRLISAFIACAMLFTMVPSYALADDNAVPMIDLVPAAPAKDVEIYVPDTTACTMAEGCTAEVHQDGCPAAQPVADEPETETDQPFEPKSGTVAKIGDMKYESLDEALAHAKDGDIIEVMQDCETQNGFAVSGQDLTIQGNNKTITANEYGIYLAKKDDDPSRLTFEGCNLVFQPKQGTPMIAGEKYTWATVVINYDCELSFKDCNVTVTPAEEGQVNTGVYYHEGSKVNLDNTDMIVSGFSQNGFSADVNDQGLPYSSELNILRGSDMEVSHNRAGVTAAMQITVNDSTFDNSWNSGNASNGADYYMTNSTVNVSYNGYHGMSARNVRSINSTITCEENGGYGITCYGTVEVDGKSTIDVLKNSSKGDYAGLYLKGTSTIQSGATVTIAENECSGLSNRGTATFEDGVDLAVIGNYNDKGTTSQGGGVYNFSGGSLSLPKGAEIYNNHADDGADDIYSAVGCKIIFGQVGSGWILDDCGDDITGWYDDSAGNRWQGDEEPYHINEFDQFEKLTGTANVVGPLALKAAHGVAPIETEPTYWEKSKSKTASELRQTEDGLYESDVTLSLPAAEEKLVSDVVFVLDYSSCTESVIKDALESLKQLVNQAETSKAKINVGAVVYRGTASEKQFPLTPLNADSLEELTAFLQTQPTIKGSNMHAGLLAAQKMLDDSSTLDNRQYMVLISDGITYSWEQNGEQYAAAYYSDGNPRYASNSAWESWYGNLNWVPEEGWDAYLDNREQMIQNTLNDRSAPYDRDNIQNAIKADERDKYANCVDVALYKCREVYRQLQSKYHCYALLSGTDGQYGASFMNYLSNGRDVSFAGIQNDIYYLLSAGSQVVDVIGSGVDNKDNDYNFDFVNNIEKLTLKVGEETLSKTELIDPQFSDPYITSAYGFGEPMMYIDGESMYPYVLKYYAKGQDGNSDECFVWDINVPVSNFAPVQLTYTVKLTNPKTEPGTYGEYDADGSQNKDSLYTNNSATLYPVDSNGDHGTPENFAKPTVSYTVEDPTITVTFKPGDHGDLRGAEAGADISYDDIKKGTGLGEDQAVPRVDEDKDWDFTKWLCTEGSADMKDQTYTAAQIAELEFDVDTVFVAQYKEESGGGGAHHPEPDPDPDDEDEEEEIIDEEVPLAETPWLNTVDHYAYIVGYPEDYVTGQPTEDESRWPVKPQANITRAEVATIFFRLLTDEARDQFWMTTNNFPDVAPDAWYNNAISTMVNAGIIQGYEDGTFRPNNNITRAEFAAIASRFMSSGYDAEKDLFTDIANHWARENINDAAMTQWIHGYPDGTFLPDQAITRAEAVTLVNNVLQRKPHADHMLDTMIKWPDNPEGAWYYEAIQEATNSHDYDLFEDAEYETWTALQENRDWAALEKDWMNAHRTGGEVM
ncbi:S-layer homology domain-containing protein [Butyricicoccus pullicaecorum]|uniref:S-layer homology domain-containing protein n=1 Tax=Butyricicoccus pullicaecorum TaxID=501571 RepID=UPI0039906CF4